jgi:hypothetical protein
MEISWAILDEMTPGQTVIIYYGREGKSYKVTQVGACTFTAQPLGMTLKQIADPAVKRKITTINAQLSRAKLQRNKHLIASLEKELLNVYRT